MTNVSSKKFRWLVWLVFLLFFSCGKAKKEPLENPTQLSKYFPLVQFLEEQITLLGGKEVSKVIAIKGREETVTLVMDQEEWRKELDLFIQADINKNSLATSYTTEDGPDLLRHTLIPGEKGEIKSLSVHRSGNKIRSIDFTFKKDNLFYLSEGSGRLSLTADGKKISRYEVKGFQKVWFLPANNMTTIGEISD